MAAHNQQHLIELDGNKPVDVLLDVSIFVTSSSAKEVMFSSALVCLCVC